jgi:protein TonB
VPRQLFEDAVRGSRAYSRNRWTVLTSTIAHLLAIAAFVSGSLMATGALPDVRGRLTAFMPADIALPEMPPPAGAPRRAASNPSAAPTTAPTTIDYTAEVVPKVEPSSGGDVGDLDSRVAGVAEGVVGGSSLAGGGVLVAPPPTQEPAKLLRVGGDVRAPQRIASAPLVYPAVAQAARIEGDVVLDAIIDATGVVRDVHVRRSVHLLDEAAVAAVRQWRYKPTLLNGVPVPVIMTVTVSFRLQ